ncbi:GNAT family N-acetyltransferase [Elizabethkingia anophelis]|uniref:GNAT family N-acetyltransferase n=1 Tax=Elizabethkingia anophelis TaxID=1117645 RepID=UPI0004E2D3DD|nr:GNAT family N-acetyltransferase [Elizabethkingia anophelis]KFC39941.1 GNAT family acetyltransferase [Elizabethkingia anophelis]MCT3787737.1 GNAT family N-acetyltransferase [Elizabethkingia anophelis]MDV3501210.1 GNAT family N-acetyltransferase [Elizabethkingia anophelis]PKR32682.1 GNAT family N-acetyltransferase [Elizabethkingia anophelis]PKR34336.1 GNAT family N-acetyltransferase [Elizabethkingia anophelis]
METPVWKVKAFEELTTTELYQILLLRAEVFVVEQNCPYQDVDNTDQKALHLWAEMGGKAVAYCRMFDQGIKYPESSIGRVVTHPEYRSHKLGRALLNLTLETIKNRYANPDIRISAQNYLLKFYGSLGFEPVGESYLEDNIPHTEMLRKHSL